MWFKNGQPFYFEAPDGLTGQKRNFPTNEAQEKAYAATIAATIVASTTLINLAEMTGDVTLNLTLNAQLEIGDTLVVKSISDTTARDITLGTGFTGTTIAGVISKTKVATFFFDGTSFLPIATIQAD